MWELGPLQAELMSASDSDNHIIGNAYLGRWQRSAWWGVWAARWRPAAQTPCCCAQLPDTAPPSSWNSRSGLWFGKPADPHLAGNQQRQDGGLDEQGEGAANPLLLSFVSNRSSITLTCTIHHHLLQVQCRKHYLDRLCTLISGLFLCSACAIQCAAEVKNKLLLENESFGCTVKSYSRAVQLSLEISLVNRNFSTTQGFTSYSVDQKKCLFFGTDQSEKQRSKQTEVWAWFHYVYKRKSQQKRLKAVKQHLCAWLWRLKVVYTDKKQLNCFWKVQIQTSKL